MYVIKVIGQKKKKGNGEECEVVRVQNMPGLVSFWTCGSP